MLFKLIIPTTGAALEAEVEQDMTADEIVENLINEVFIPHPKPCCFWALCQSGKQSVSGSMIIGESEFDDGSTVYLYQM